jgi:hypothetical protein
MLRTLVALLLLVNALFFAWTRGWLDPVLGVGPDAGREPQRQQQEQQPQRMALLSAQAASAVQQPVCLEFGPFASDESLRAAQGSLERLGLAAASWQVDTGEQPGVWVLATAKLDARELARREEAFKRLKINVEPLDGKPDEQPALVLSRHGSEAAAQAALEARRNIRELRVLQLQPPQARHLVRLPQANSLLAKQIADAKDRSLGASRVCSPAAAAAAASAVAASAAASGASR